MKNIIDVVGDTISKYNRGIYKMFNISDASSLRVSPFYNTRDSVETSIMFVYMLSSIDAPKLTLKKFVDEFTEILVKATGYDILLEFDNEIVSDKYTYMVYVIEDGKKYHIVDYYNLLIK